MHPMITQLRKNFQTRRGSLAKALRRESMQLHGMNCCQKCKHKFHEDKEQEQKLRRCELHHIKQLKHFSFYGSSFEELKQKLNQPSNLVQLCFLCHKEFHDLYEDKLDPAQDLANFHEFMANPNSGDYLKGYMERLKLKKQRRKEAMRKHAKANRERRLRKECLARG